MNDILNAGERRALILNFVRNHRADTGQPPTHLQIRVGLQFRSNNLLNADLQALKRDGLIARNGGEPTTFYATEQEVSS